MLLEWCLKRSCRDDPPIKANRDLSCTTLEMGILPKDYMTSSAGTPPHPASAAGPPSSATPPLPPTGPVGPHTPLGSNGPGPHNMDPRTVSQ